MAITLNELLNLPPDATFEDRQFALRSLSLSDFRSLVDQAVGLYISARVAYAVLRETIVPNSWDIRNLGEDYQAMWGEHVLATAPIKKGNREAAINSAEKSLYTYFHICYPVQLENFPTFDIVKEAGIYNGIKNGEIRARGVDPFSVLYEMVDLSFLREKAVAA